MGKNKRYPVDVRERAGRLVRSKTTGELTWEPEPEYQHTVDNRRLARAGDQQAELDAFAHWFADWWLRRGRHLTAPERDDAHTLSDS